MPVQFRDYYAALGVERSASTEQIRAAHRRLARKYHPDVNHNNPTAGERFREVQEAWEVLGNPNRRRAYDLLAADYREGMDFKVPPDWKRRADRGQASPPPREKPQTSTPPKGHEPSKGGRKPQTDDAGTPHKAPGADGGATREGPPPRGFSEFFNLLFGAGAKAWAGIGEAATAGFHAPPKADREKAPPRTGRGEDVETFLAITLDEAFHGTTRNVRFHSRGACPACQGRGAVAGSRCGACRGDGMTLRARSIELKVPAGAREGLRLRLTGQGSAPAKAGHPAGDIIVTIRIQPHPVFRLEGDRVLVDLPVTPWEAVLGAEVEVPTLDGSVRMLVPAGTANGTRLRLRRHGMRREAGRGDQIVTIRIEVPNAPSDKERELFEKLREVSGFRPRVKKRSSF